MTRSRPHWQSYALAAAIFVALLALRFLLLPKEYGIPYLTFFPGVVVCALLTGWRPTLLYIALAAPAGVYFFNPPYFNLGPHDIILIAAFTASALFMLAAIEWYKHRSTVEPITVGPSFGLSEKKVIGGLALALTLLTLLGVTIYARSGYHANEITQTARTHEVQTRIESLLSQVTNAETGLRGYIITGDEAFLAPYLGARARATENMVALRGLTQDHLLQRQRLDRLIPLLEKRFDLIEAAIALRQDAGFEAARARTASGEGKALQDQIRSVLNEMRVTQAQLALDQVNETRVSAHTSVIFGILSLAGALAALGFALWLVVQELRGRRRAEAEVHRLNAALNAHVGELEVRLQLAARASQTGFWDWDLHSNEVFFSPEWKSQLGYTDDEIANRFDEWESRVHPDDLPGALQRVQTYLAAPSGDYGSEFRMRHRNGDYRWILARAQVLLDQVGKPYRMLGSHIDITERKEMEETLSESEHKLRLVMDGIGSDMFMGLMTPEGVLIEANLPALNAGGLARGDVLDKPLDEAPWWSYSPMIQAQLRDAITLAQRGTASRYDVQVRLAGGVIAWIDFSLQPLFDSHGKVNYMVPSAAVIETRKRAEEALRESKDLLQLFIEHAPVSLAMFDQDMRYLAVSQQWSDDYALGPQHLLGRSHYEIFPEINQDWKEIHRRSLAGETIRADEDSFVRADGRVQWLKWVVLPWRNSQGAVGGIIIFSEDISVRKQLEQVIVNSAREFRNLAEAMPQIVWVTPADGMTTYLNQRWVDYTGLTLEESYGQGWLKPFHPEDQARAWEAWQNAVNNNGLYAIECRLRRADGVYRWWLIRGVPILDAEGKIEKWFGTCTDIEDIKQVETALREKNTELERFTYMISHDLKSPLVTIRTFLTYLEQDLSTSDTQRVAQDIGYIASAAQKMSRMLDELLEFSRVGRVRQTRSDVTWREIVDEALMLTAGAIATHAVQVEIDEINVPLQGERARFVQIWQNLIDNAVKFMGQQAAPTIRIGIEENAAQSVFFVCDNGVGIAPQYHAKIFGLFEKLDANAPGTGLGLALVQRIVENYGGVIHVASAGENSGTCFRFTLPDAIYNKQ